jgi:branched-chain amino acid transport system substrate-binding protein
MSRLLIRWIAVLALATLSAGCGSDIQPKEFLGAWRTPGPEAAPAPDRIAAAPAGATPAATAPAGASAPVTAGTPAPTVPGRVAVPTVRAGAAVTAPAGSPATKSAAAAAPDPGRTREPAPGGRPAPAATPVAPVPAPGAAPGAPQEIRLGSFGTGSGPVGQIMVPYVQGAKAWVADVNARGGLAGHPLRLILADDGGNPNQALALAKRMVDTDKVQAFFALHAPTTLQAVMPYLEEQRIPAIGTCPCNPAADESPMNFSPQTGATVGLAWEHLAPLVTYSDKRRVGLLYCREVSLCANTEAIIRKIAPAAGIEIVYRGQVSLAQPDFTAEVIQARNAGAEVLIPIMDNASVVRILRSAHRQDFRPLVSVQRATFDERFLQQGGEEVEGVMTAATTLPWNTAPQLADFRAAIDRYVPGAAKSTVQAETWAAGKMVEILARTFPADPRPADFLDALYGLRNETVGGLFPPVTFQRDSGHGAVNQCVIPVRVERGAFVPSSQDRFVCAPGWKPAGGG